MMAHYTFAFSLAFLVGGLPATAQTLPGVLSKMDQAAASFRGVSADLKRQSHTAVIDETIEESGLVRLKKRGNDLAMLIEFTAPDRKLVSFSGQKAQIFYPKINTVQEYDLGKQKDLVNQFLLLGFGTSGKELSRNYDVKLVGQETVSGKNTAHLELTPKSKKVAEQVRRIELWVDMESGQPMRQKFWQSAGDFTQVEYSNLKLTPGMPDSDVALNLPAGVKREYPQK